MLELYPGPARARPRAGVMALFGTVLLSAALLVGLSATASSAGIQSSKTDNSAGLDEMCWQVVPSPNQDAPDHYLRGVAAVSPNDVWAVGYYGSFGLGGWSRTLIEHWNGTTWEVASSPNPGSAGNFLYGVAAVSTNDVWAVGVFANGFLDGHTLTMHWSGTAWTVVSSPNGVGIGSLNGVTAVSTNDVWAVGMDWWGVDAGQSWTLAMHWNGTNWSLITTPNLGLWNRLYGVAAISTNDVWAVGDALGVLTIHWDGAAWTVVPNSSYGTLYGVAAISTNDVWAVGGVTLHWDGKVWTPVSSPGPPRSRLYGVAAASANDVWAVGYYENNGVNQTLMKHWNGTAWSVVPSPNQGALSNELYGVSTLSSGDVWTVGRYAQAEGVYRTLVERYVPCNPTPVPTATLPTTPIPPSPTNTPTNVPANTPTLTSVPTSTAIPPSPVPPTATSLSSTETTVPPLATVTTVPSSTIVPSTATEPPTATGTIPPVPPTATSIPPSETAVATATSRPPSETAVPPTETAAPPTTTAIPPAPCAVSFSDVPPGSTFYPFVRCLACQGIVSGYSSGCASGSPCFRPNSLITRGQIAKIVSNAAGFKEPVASHTYQDVLPGSNFYEFIERLASRGVMAGYSCGQRSAEPCMAPANLPYFRPSNTATRGQLAKIVSNAAGFTNSPTGQTFEDVPHASTFYPYVERLLANRPGVMSGYACGGPGEPCVAPGNRPYFRPNNAVTRGQAAKIVANTFFPDCEALGSR